MKKLIFILIIITFTGVGCASLPGTNPTVTGPNGNVMEIPNGGMPGLKAIGGLLKVFKK